MKNQIKSNEKFILSIIFYVKYIIILYKMFLFFYFCVLFQLGTFISQILNIRHFLNQIEMIGYIGPKI